MPMYAYKGIGATGKAVAGVRDADSPKMLRQLLRKEGVVITASELSKQGKGGAAAGSGLSRQVDFGGILGGVKKQEIAAFTRQLATLLRAGIPLAESLGALFEQAENVRFKVPLGEVRTAVNEGTSLSDALGKHPKLFDELFVSMVRAGETAGNLDEVLLRLADFQESTQKLKSKVQSAMIYPVIMIVVCSAIMLVLMIAVVPEITKMFTAQGKVLPINTRLLIWSSAFIGHYFWVLLILVPLIVVGFRRWIRSESGRPIWHRAVLRIPGVGPMVRQVNVARFTRTLGTMLHSGVPLLRALDIGKQVMGNVIMRGAVDDAKKAVTEGESLALTLRRSGHFPATMIHMMAVGERSGQLESMLSRVAEQTESEVDTKLSRMTATLEPMMIVIMGGAIAFVVFSILQPIMDMGTFKR